MLTEADELSSITMVGGVSGSEFSKTRSSHGTRPGSTRRSRPGGIGTENFRVKEAPRETTGREFGGQAHRRTHPREGACHRHRLLPRFRRDRLSCRWGFTHTSRGSSQGRAASLHSMLIAAPHFRRAVMDRAQCVMRSMDFGELQRSTTKLEAEKYSSGRSAGPNFSPPTHDHTI